jgi:outer membrane protein OmpA-like peptidoglycan-associated protein
LKTFVALSFIFTLELFKLSGQTVSQELAQADNSFSNNNFSAALPHYLNLLKNDSNDKDLNLKIGTCYLNSRSKKFKATGYLEKAASESSPVTYKLLGDSYNLSGKFDLAILSYEKFKKIFLANKPKDISIIDDINWKMEMCKIGKKLQELNTTQAYHVDYISALSFDQSVMTFTFQKSNGIIKKSFEDEKYFDNIYIPDKADTARSPETIDTTTNKNEAEVATSVDGQLVLLYKDDEGDGNLYISKLTGNTWTTTEELNRSINISGWETDEFISADGTTMYFTSKRPGGFGGKDIYVCKKMASGEWGKAVNLGPVINSPFDEEAPYIYSDGQTLFFSSNKNKRNCCFDNFSSTLTNNGSWSAPVKIGYPVKKPSEDVYYAATTGHLKKETYTAPEKEDGYDTKDIYLATFVDQKKTPFTVLKGKMMDVNGKIPSHGKITITDNETGEVLGIYNVNYKTGDFIITLSPGRNNNIAYESDGYLFQSENIDINKTSDYYKINKVIQLSPVAEGSKTTLNNIFFDDDLATFRPVSTVELNKLFLLLSTNTDLSVEFSYSIDAKENNRYDTKLAMYRSEAIANYLIQRGIGKERVRAREPEKIKSTRQKGRSDKKEIETEEQPTNRLELKILSNK